MALMATIPPDGITCPDWERGERLAPADIGDCQRCGRFDDLFDSGGDSMLCSRCTGNPGCKYFVEAKGHGACKMPSRFMCMEWEKVVAATTRWVATPSSAVPGLAAPAAAAPPPGDPAKGPGGPQDASGGADPARAPGRPAEPNLVPAIGVHGAGDTPRSAVPGTPAAPFVAQTACPAPGCGKLQARVAAHGWACADGHDVGAPSWQVCECGHEYPDHSAGGCRGLGGDGAASCACVAFRLHIPSRDLFGVAESKLVVASDQPATKTKKGRARSQSGASSSTEPATQRRYQPITRAVAAVPRSGAEGARAAPETAMAPSIIEASWVDALERAGCEIKLETVGGPEITLVPARTDQDRLELTFREGLVLSEIMRVFPGARIAAITKSAEADVDEDAFE